MKFEYKVNYDGYTVIVKETNTRTDYSFPEGYEAVVKRRYKSDTLEFVSESRWTNALYRSSLKMWNDLITMEEEAPKLLEERTMV